MYVVGSDCRLTLSCELSLRLPPWLPRNHGLGPPRGRYKTKPPTAPECAGRLRPLRPGDPICSRRQNQRLLTCRLPRPTKAFSTSWFRSKTQSTTSVGRERLREAQAASLSAAEDVWSWRFGRFWLNRRRWIAWASAAQHVDPTSERVSRSRNV